MSETVSGGLAKMKDYPLSDADIKKILGSDIPVLTYPDLGKFHSIDQCFDSKGRCIILFLTTGPTEGHWCCMMRKKEGIYFFDPYGEPPEEQKDDIPEEMKRYLDIDEPYLMRLLKSANCPVYYNTHQYQKLTEGVNTCGRWCVARLLYASKSDEYFKSVVDKFCRETKKTPDDFVSALLANWLGK